MCQLILQLKIQEVHWINRDLLTRFKVNVNPNRKFVLSHWIESSITMIQEVNLPLKKIVVALQMK